jgi:nucleoid DNA-binding protein
MSEKVTFQELIESIAEETNSTKQFTHNFLKDFVDVINSGLERDGNVNIAGLGKFELRHVDEREGYNPQTEERMTIPAHNRIVFKPYKDLRELVNAPYAHLEPELIKEEFKSSRKGEAEEETASDEEDFIPTAPPTSHKAEENLESEPDTGPGEPPFDLDEPETKTSPSFSFEEEHFEDTEDDEEDIVEFSGETTGDDKKIDDDLSEFLRTEETESTSEATGEEIEKPVDETADEETSPFSPDFQASEDQKDDEDEKVIATSASPTFDSRRGSRKNNSPVTIIAAAVIIFLLVAGGAWYLGVFSGNDAEQTVPNQAVSATQTPSATENQDNQSGEQTQTTEDNRENEEQTQQTAQADQSQQTAQAGQTQQADQPQQNDRESMELTIAKGQTLWSIADEQYRNSQLWPWIYDNNESLNNPNIIHAGNTLTIPLPSGPSQYGLTASDSVAVAKGYITTYRWYKDNGSSAAKNYLWVAKRYHEDISDIAEVQIDKADLAFANNAR